MTTQTFFSSADRKVILGSPTLQSTSRRICVPVRMPLSGQSFVGMPDWISTAFESVSQYLTEATPQVEQIADVNLSFFNDPRGELFETPSVKVPQCELKKFVVVRVPDGENEDMVELQFKAYLPFTRDFWEWIGEMAGHEVIMAFPSSLAGTVAVAKPEAGKIQYDALGDGDDQPEDTVVEGIGSQYEEQVRKSLGAPEPLGDAPRMVVVRPEKVRTEKRKIN